MVRRSFIVFCSIVVTTGLMGAAMPDPVVVLQAAVRVGNLDALVAALCSYRYRPTDCHEALNFIPPCSSSGPMIAVLLGVGSNLPYSDNVRLREKKLGEALLDGAGLIAARPLSEEDVLAMDDFARYKALKAAIVSGNHGNFRLIAALHAAKKITIDLNYSDAGETLLMCAVCHHLKDVTKWLLESGARASINVGDAFGDTPLIIAARLADVHIVGLLLAAGANKQIKNKRGETARDVAEFAKSIRIHGFFLETAAQQCMELIDGVCMA